MPQDVATKVQDEEAEHEVERTSAAIYGTIVLSSALAGSAGRSLGGVILTGVSTVLIYWIAEEYAWALAHHAIAGRVARAAAWTRLRNGLPMMEATFGPLVVVVLAGMVGAPVSDAVTWGLVSASCLLGAFGAIAARKSGARRLGTIGSAVIAAALGGAVVVLKVTLH